MEMGSFQQLRNIYEAIRNHKKVNLFGSSGVGKTWMANKVSDRCSRDKFNKESDPEKVFQFTLWVFLCIDYNKKSLTETLARQVGLLPIDDMSLDDSDDDDDVYDHYGNKRQDINNEAENLKTLIKKLHKKLSKGKILLFLDDVPSDEGERKEKEDKFWSEWSDILRAPDGDENLHTVLISLSSREEDISKEIAIEVKPLPKEEMESLLIQKLDAQVTPSAITLGKQLLESSNGLPGNVIMIAKALNYYGLDRSGVSVLEKEIEGASETYGVKSLLCRMHSVLPTGVLKDLCQPSRHFFRDSGSIYYNELITYWILEGYLGFGSVNNLYEKGHQVLIELTDCSILKQQEGGYVYMDKSALNVHDLHQCADKNASLGLATVFKTETKGLGIIMPADGMLKAADQIMVKKKRKNKHTQIYKEEDPILRTLLLDGAHFDELAMMEFLKSHKELEVLALFNPTIKSLPEPLQMMKSLRVLVLRGCEFLQDIKLPLDDLLVLEISGAKSLKRIPVKFFKNMLKLQSLHLSQLPVTFLPSSLYSLTKLQWLTVKDCPSLKKIKSLAELKDLRFVDLSGNTSLALMDKNFVELKKLRSLNLSNTMLPATPILTDSKKLSHLLVRNCKNLGRLRGLTSLEKLQTLDLSGSTLFEDFHDSSLKSLVSLQTLNLSGTNLDLLPSRIANPRYLYLQGCTQLKQLSCVKPLEELEILDVSGAKNLSMIKHDFFDRMTGLRVLNLSETNVVVLPSISNISNLCELNLSQTKVAALPSISHLSNLRELLLSGCASLEQLPTLEFNTKLEVLDVSHCSALKDIGIDSFERMTRLQKLDLSETKIKALPPISHLSNLCQLLLKNTTNLQNLELNVSLPNLVELNLYGTTSLGSNGAEFLKHMSNLKILDLSFTLHVCLPCISNLTNLTHLSLAGCSRLETFPDFSCLTKLEILDLSGSSCKQLPDLSRCSNLRNLLLKDCYMVEESSLVVNDILDSPTKIQHDISELSHLEYLELPNVPLPSTSQEMNQDEWKICHLSDTDKSPMFVSGSQFLQIFKRSPSPQEMFHLCAVPLNVESESVYKYGWRSELVFPDVYLRATQFARYEENRSLQIRGFGNFPKGIENVISHVDLVFMIDDKSKSLVSGLGASVLSKLKGCWIERCNEMVTVVEEEDREIALENLGISNNSQLESICNGKQPFRRFKELKTLYLDCCPKLSTVFSSSWLPETLKVLQIKYCDNVVSMFEGDGKLLNLEVLQLWELPELENIGISFPCLQTLKIWNCPKMKQIEEILESTKGHLKTLWIAGDICLKTLYTSSDFINLRTLKVESCPTLLNISSSSLPPANIEDMDIRYCEKLQTLFADSNSADYALRSLKKLHLQDLPMLESIGAALPPLEHHFVMECERLKN